MDVILIIIHPWGNPIRLTVHKIEVYFRNTIVCNLSIGSSMTVLVLLTINNVIFYGGRSR